MFMKKVVVVLIVAILIVFGLIGFMYLRGRRSDSNSNKTDVTTDSGINYGNRGNISQVEKVKFLSKNDEYLVGMIGLPISAEVKQFSDDDMIRFALNVAVTRYSNMLTTKNNKDGSKSFFVPTSVVNSITAEYFGVKEVEFDQDKNEYYSKSNKTFILDELPEITLYYYPVTMNEIDGAQFTSIGVITEPEVLDDASTETEIETNDIKEKKYKEVIADAIFISDDKDVDTIENAKFNGKYSEDEVDSSIKFIFNGEGTLVAYQYM